MVLLRVDIVVVLFPCSCSLLFHDQDMERERLRGEAGDAMEDVEEEDTVPEILPRHFEDAVRNARRSVSDRDLAQYSSFAQNLQQARFFFLFFFFPFTICMLFWLCSLFFVIFLSSFRCCYPLAVSHPALTGEVVRICRSLFDINSIRGHKEIVLSTRVICDDVNEAG